MEEYRNLRDLIHDIVIINVPGEPEQVERIADQIIQSVMDEVSQHFRSLSQVEEIICATRNGISVQIEYRNPEDEDNDGVTVKARW